MLRTALAAVAGYAVMLVIIFVTFSGLYLAIGADRAFQPGTYEVSALWLVTSFALSLVAAIAGGLVCARIGGQRAARALAVLVVVLGVVAAMPALDPSTDPRPTVRDDDVPNLEAMANARQPGWVALSLPIVGAVGVMVGARLKSR